MPGWLAGYGCWLAGWLAGWDGGGLDGRFAAGHSPALPYCTAPWCTLMYPHPSSHPPPHPNATCSLLVSFRVFTSQQAQAQLPHIFALLRTALLRQLDAALEAAAAVGGACVPLLPDAQVRCVHGWGRDESGGVRVVWLVCCPGGRCYGVCLCAPTAGCTGVR